MKRLSLKQTLSVVGIIGALCISTSSFSALTMPVKLQAVLGKKTTASLSATEHAFINDYVQKVSNLLKDLFSHFDDYTNPLKGGSHTEYTDKATAKVADYKKLMDSLKEKMDGCTDKNGNFYKLLAKAHAIAHARYQTLEAVCQVMKSYKGSSSMQSFLLGSALSPLKEKLTSAEANTQLRNELLELQSMMIAVNITNTSQLQPIIDDLAKPVTESNKLAQIDILTTRLSNG